MNPDHLEPVTHRENALRGINVGMKTHCVNGHEYTPENTRTTPNGRRRCRACAHERNRIYRMVNRDKINEDQRIRWNDRRRRRREV